MYVKVISEKLRKAVFFSLFFFSILSVRAQMGVGTDMPDPAAELEVKSNNRGLLIPRIALTNNADQTTITAGNIESLLVYNTTSNTSLSPGFYYWQNNRWKRLSDDQNLPDNIVIWDDINQQFTYIDSNGQTQVIDLNFDETLTQLELSADQKNLIYTDENANQTSIDLQAVVQQWETLTSLVENNDGTISYFDEEGNETIINLAEASETLTYLVWNQNDHQLVYTDENGDSTEIDLQALIQQYETLTSLVDNENGSISYFDEEGNETIINLASASETLTFLVWNQDDHQLVYTDENGDSTEIDLNALVQQYETLTSLVDNENGSISYFDEEGNETIINLASASETLTFLVWNQDDHQLVYTDENGDSTEIDLQALIQQYETLTSLVDNNNGTISYFDEEGNETIIDLADASETLTFLVLNEDGDLVYTDENGEDHVISIENVGETITTLTDNGDGTITYTNEANEETTINLEASQQVFVTQTDYQPVLSDRVILGDASNNDILITLPDPADFEGKKFTIKKEDQNEEYYINVSGAISGIAADEQLYTAMPFTGWDFVSDGSTWRIVNKF